MNNNIVNLLEYWKEESHIFTWLHNNSSEYYIFINKVLTIPCIFISALSSTTILSNLNNVESKRYSEQTYYILIAVAILLIISTFFQSLKEFLNLEKNIKQHREASKYYKVIVVQIEEELYHYKYFNNNQGRNNLLNFMKYISKKKQDIIKSSPDIPNKIWDKLKNKIEKGDILNIMNSTILYNYLNNQLVNLESVNRKDTNMTNNTCKNTNMTNNTFTDNDNLRNNTNLNNSQCLSITNDISDNGDLYNVEPLATDNDLWDNYEQELIKNNMNCPNKLKLCNKIYNSLNINNSNLIKESNDNDTESYLSIKDNNNKLPLVGSKYNKQLMYQLGRE